MPRRLQTLCSVRDSGVLPSWDTLRSARSSILCVASNLYIFIIIYSLCYVCELLRVNDVFQGATHFSSDQLRLWRQMKTTFKKNTDATNKVILLSCTTSVWDFWSWSQDLPGQRSSFFIHVYPLRANQAKIMNMENTNFFKQKRLKTAAEKDDETTTRDSNYQPRSNVCEPSAAESAARLVWIQTQEWNQISQNTLRVS